MQYQIYDIKLVEDGRGEWKGRIRRQDRRLIKWESNDTPRAGRDYQCLPYQRNGIGRSEAGHQRRRDDRRGIG
jgi:hypothetical protein